MKPREQISWPLFLAIACVVLGTAGLMVHNTTYLAGEGMSLIYLLGLIIGIGLVFYGFLNRLRAMWGIILICGSLVLWQAHQARRWAILQEEVVSIIAHAKRAEQETGSFPANLSAYAYMHPSTREFIHYELRGSQPSISYFLDRNGTKFWYGEEEGFHYDPG